MKNLMFTLFISCLLFVPTQVISETDEHSDELLKQKIIGSWCKGETPYGVTTFKEDGGYEGKIYMSTERSELLMEIEGEWWIEDGKLYNKLTSTEPLVEVVGSNTIVDRIIGISDTKLALLDANGKRYVKTRVKR